MSKKSDAFRRLMGAIPSPPELSGAMLDLQMEPDRSAAIMAGALVEASLERLLRCSFKSANTVRNNSLFGPNGPLASFAGKISVAAAFGILPEGAARDISSIKTIRNVFAHSAVNIDFTHPDIAGETEKMVMLQGMLAAAPKGNERAKAFFSGKSGFLVAAHMISIILDDRIKERGGERLYSDEAHPEISATLAEFEED